MAAARLDAMAADEIWSQASDTGGFRVRIAIASFLATAVLLGFVIGQLLRIGRLGRRSRRRTPAGTPIGAPLGSRPTHYPTRYPSRDSARTSRGTLADQPVRMARRVRPEPKEGDKSS